MSANVPSIKAATVPTTDDLVTVVTFPVSYGSLGVASDWSAKLRASRSSSAALSTATIVVDGTARTVTVTFAQASLATARGTALELPAIWSLYRVSAKSTIFEQSTVLVPGVTP